MGRLRPLTRCVRFVTLAVGRRDLYVSICLILVLETLGADHIRVEVYGPRRVVPEPVTRLLLLVGGRYGDCLVCSPCRFSSR